MQIHNLIGINPAKQNLTNSLIMLFILAFLILIYKCRDDLEQVEFWKRTLNNRPQVQPLCLSVHFETIVPFMNTLMSNPYSSAVLEKIIFSARVVYLSGHTFDEFKFVMFFKMLKKMTLVKNIQLTEWQSQKNNNYRFSIRIEL